MRRFERNDTVATEGRLVTDLPEPTGRLVAKVSRSLDESDVEYLLVGRCAVALYEHPTNPNLVEVWIGEGADNAARATKALLGLDGLEDASGALDFLPDDAHTEVLVDKAKVRILRTLEGPESFAKALEHKEIFQVEGHSVATIAVWHLTDSLRRARPSDAEEIRALAKIVRQRRWREKRKALDPPPKRKKEDPFSFYGMLDDDSWFARFFNQNYEFLHYIGDRDRIVSELERWPSHLNLFKAIAKFVSIKKILRDVLKMPIPEGDSDKTVASVMLEWWQDEEKRKTLLDQATRRQERLKGTTPPRNFESLRWPVPTNRSEDKRVYDNAEDTDLDDKLVAIRGHLIHLDALKQYAPRRVPELQGSEWLLGDYPPHGLVDANNAEKDFLILKAKPSFKSYEEGLPFLRGTNWYPYARVTGFYSRPARGENKASVCTGLVEFRRPRSYNDAEAEFITFAEDEARDPFDLRERSDLLLFAYVLPFLFSQARLDPVEHGNSDLADLMAHYVEAWGGDLPVALGSFYSDLLEHRTPASPTDH